MIRAFATATLVLGSLTLSGLHAFRQGQISPAPVPQAPVQTDCVNVFEQEPLVVFDVSGYSLLGLIHKHLTVYSSGLATISEAGGGTPISPFASKADVAFLPIHLVQKFWNSVMQAGAMSICEHQILVADVPLTTVTVHRGTTDSRAHTYSYYFPSTPEASAVHQHIQKFIQDNFPGF